MNRIRTLTNLQELSVLLQPGVRDAVIHATNMHSGLWKSSLSPLATDAVTHLLKPAESTLVPQIERVRVGFLSYAVFEQETFIWQDIQIMILATKLTIPFIGTVYQVRLVFWNSQTNRFYHYGVIGDTMKDVLIEPQR